MGVTLPLFPLNTPLVPGLVMPLHIFEPRYRGLVEDLLANPDEDSREFGIIAVRTGQQIDRTGVDALYPIGTSTVLRQAERLDDGRFDIVTTGSRRFRLLDIDMSEPLIRGQVEFLDDITSESDSIVARRVAQEFTTYRAILGGQLIDESDAAVDDLPDDPTVLSYLVTAAMVLESDERQDLLAASDTASRLIKAHRALVRENHLISILGAVPALELLANPPSAN
jgi:Lon protease-like protein